MMSRVQTVVVALAIALSLGWVVTAATQKNDPDAIAARAQELSQQTESQVHRIRSMPQFVQDEIKQTKTTYG